MAKTFEELKSQANLIKDETIPAANTASRVGGTILDMVEKVEVADTETKKMIKGQSANTDPKTDPHKWLGEVAVSTEGQQQINSWLNEMNDMSKVGYYRGSYGGSFFEVETIGTSFADGNYVQSVRGTLSISSDKISIQYGGSYRILVRTCTNNTWGKWEEYLLDEINSKPGIVTEHGEVFNNESNTVGESGVDNHAEGQGTVCNGSCCHAEGVDTYASSYASHAEGQKTVTAGSASHSEGIECVANGDASHAEGYKTTANGIYSHAEGANTQAGAQGHAEGNGSIAGDTGHAEGKNTISNGNFSHSEGDGTEATGDSSHSEGYRTKATGRQAHSEGNSTVASGHYSHAEGNSTVASGEFTHTEGHLTTATGKYSHSEGHSCSALGLSSHAEGENTISNGNYSHAEGLYTEVAKFCGHVEGKYNRVTDSIHILGCGASDTDRKNLHEIKEDGSQYMIGIGGYNGKNRDTAKDLATVLNEGLPTNLIFVNRNFPTNNEQLTEDDKSLLYRLSSGTTTGIFFHNAYIVFPVSVNVSKYGGGGSIQYTIAISYIFDGYEETATASLTKNGLNTSYSENWSVVKKEFTSGGNETIQIPETVIYPSMGLTYFGSIFAEYVEPGTYIYNAKNNDNEREKSVGRLVVFKDTVINKTVQMLYDYKYSDDDPNNIIETTRKVRFVVSPQESGDWADF